MRASRLTLAAAVLLAPLAALTPAGPLAAQGIEVDDLQNGVRFHQLNTTPPLRRGVTSNVRIIKDLIDLVPFNMVSISGGNIGSISNGRTSAGKGYIQMNVTLSPAQALGSTVTIKVGLSDQFPFTVVRTGQVTSITRTPNPSTLQPGTPFTVALQGIDLGAPTLAANCHTAVLGTVSNTSIPVTLTRNAGGCVGTTSYTFSITPAGTGAPPSYVMTDGSPAQFAFQYLPPPPTGTVCASNPNLGTPIVRSPAANQVIVLGAGTVSPTNVTVRWDSVTANGSVAPNNEWLVSHSATQRRTTNVVSIAPTLSSPITVTGTSRALPFAIPGTYTVQIAPRNCGQAAPSTRVTFTLQYQ